ncbi:MAG: serine/threonine-protein kinase [Coleofasciculus chthonoplastes F3-SA18-01]|uniref:serine/threonine protein kinase n=1 Tax=Coleofasciculus chthonoplastes TaxID=64178 RepID=UPI0032F2E038
MAWALRQRLQGGKYTIEQKLGEGGFGVTYRAWDNNGQMIVIKTLNDNVQRRPDFAKFQQDFLNEALRLAKCSHPHIVKIYEVIQEGELWCMVMEYIDGEDLASRIENQGALTEAEALRYIQQVGEALTVVHNNGLLHRDVKPQNIMLRSGKLEAVLIDFGIARDFTPNLTQTHTQMVSDGFAPIEQYDKRSKRGAYTDVYALAATLYSLLTGEAPTIAPLRAINMSFLKPKEINSTISDRVNQAILKGILIYEHWWNGTAKVAINGNLDPKTNDVIIRELEVISGYWRLGENKGTLSSDGKQLFGRGKDKKGLYKWSFQRLD